jgi:hypothetical protein
MPGWPVLTLSGTVGGLLSLLCDSKDPQALGAVNAAKNPMGVVKLQRIPWPWSHQVEFIWNLNKDGT